MILILAATPEEYEDIQRNEINRLKIDSDTRDFILKNPVERVRVMTGYPRDPRSFYADLATVLLDGKRRSFAVFRPVCALCARQNFCENFCDGIDYEKAKN